MDMVKVTNITFAQFTTSIAVTWTPPNITYGQDIDKYELSITNNNDTWLYTIQAPGPMVFTIPNLKVSKLHSLLSVVGWWFVSVCIDVFNFLNSVCHHGLCSYPCAYLSGIWHLYQQLSILFYFYFSTFILVLFLTKIRFLPWLFHQPLLPSPLVLFRLPMARLKPFSHGPHLSSTSMEIQLTSTRFKFTQLLQAFLSPPILLSCHGSNSIHSCTTHQWTGRMYLRRLHFHTQSSTILGINNSFTFPPSFLLFPFRCSSNTILH